MPLFLDLDNQMACYKHINQDIIPDSAPFKYCSQRDTILAIKFGYIILKREMLSIPAFLSPRIIIQLPPFFSPGLSTEEWKLHAKRMEPISSG
jgi:hypothetical protein